MKVEDFIDPYLHKTWAELGARILASGNRVSVTLGYPAQGAGPDSGASTDVIAAADRKSNDGYEVVPNDLAVVSVNATGPKDADRVKYRPICIPNTLLNGGASITTATAATADAKTGEGADAGADAGKKRQLENAGVGVGGVAAGANAGSGSVDDGSVQKDLQEQGQRPRGLSIAAREAELLVKEVLDDDESRL